jgi:hypothetical protein
MLAVPAALLTGLALVPGMPRLAFIATAIGAGVRGAVAGEREPEEAPEEPTAAIELRVAGAGAGDAAGAAAAAGGAAAALRDGAGDRGAGLRGAGGAGQAIAGAVEVRHGVRVLGVVTAAELTGLMGQGEEDMSFGPGKEPAAAVIEALLIACFRAVMNNAEALYDLQQLEAALERARRRHPAAGPRGAAGAAGRRSC